MLKLKKKKTKSRRLGKVDADFLGSESTTVGRDFTRTSKEPRHEVVTAGDLGCVGLFN